MKKGSGGGGGGGGSSGDPREGHEEDMDSGGF